ncbi:MAG TPA: GntR family transcriptional regulator [Candidatus Dormibacteraeota bacterium]
MPDETAVAEHSIAAPSTIGGLLGRVKVMTKSEATYAELRSRILDGSLPAGSALNQETLALTLGVSVTPLREAMRRLEGERLLEVRSDKTVCVVPLTLRELVELRQVRLQLDPFAASLAATAATAKQRRALVLRAEFQPSADLLAWHEAHLEFHRLIHEMANNTVLSVALAQLWERLSRYRLVALSDGDLTRSTSAVPHSELARAIAAADPTEADRLTRLHLQVVLGDDNGSLEARIGTVSRPLSPS